MLRKIFFWLHLSAGVLVGIVILIMSFTGVLLAWQRQVIHWADHVVIPPPPDAPQSRLSVEQLLARALESRRALPTALTIRSDPGEPVAAEYGRESLVYLSPWTGEVLGEGSRTARRFFRQVEDWHRWLAAGADSRALGRGATGLANLLFLGLLLSGVYLWLPKRWNVHQLRSRLWFQRGPGARARDWNWHHTIGIWCLLPLSVIVVSGVVMSYPWANELVYKMMSSEVPSQGQAGKGRSGRANLATSVPASSSLVNLDRLWARAAKQVAGWKRITLRLPVSPKAPVQFQLDSGDGGRPDLRAQLTLDRETGEVVRWEPFESGSPGRRLRTWLRFSHTGEAAGPVGVAIAAVASLGACFLAYTGMSLAIRRLSRSLVRRSQRQELPAVEGERA